jgi:hypothetical protein
MRGRGQHPQRCTAKGKSPRPFRSNRPIRSSTASRLFPLRSQARFEIENASAGRAFNTALPNGQVFSGFFAGQPARTAMTEAEWSVCADPMAMLRFLRESGLPNERKLRLFGVACSRRIWDKIDPLGRTAVEVAERFADGQATPAELRTARLACKSAGESASWYAAASRPEVAARNAALSAQTGLAGEAAIQAVFLRDIVGNPFRPSAFDFTRPTKSIVNFAASIYAVGVFERLPQLAEMLMNAGCSDEEIVGHCRSAGPHIRGCWVVDALTGRV